MKRLLLIYNPYSGKMQIKNNLSDVIDIFVKSEYSVTVHPTQAPLDALNVVVKYADFFDLVVCSGGDGTLNEIITGFMKINFTANFGYIPSGTTNDFATSLGLSKNMITAAEAIMSGTTFPCDVGSFNDSYFTYISAFGAFTQVAYETSQQVKNILGHLAYVIQGIMQLSSIKTYHMVVEHDGIAIEDDFAFGMISNSMSVGGFKGGNDRGIVLDDGLFEVALVKMPKNPIDFQITLNHLLKFHVDSDYIYFFKTAELRIIAVEEVSWTLDGEFGGKTDKAIIRNHKQAINIIR